MRNLLNIQGAPNSYFGVLKSIEQKINNILPITEEGQIFINELSNKFFTEIERNGAPLLLVGGQESKSDYDNFSVSDLIVYNFGQEVSNLIKQGDNNLLINLCAEEHFLKTGNVAEWCEDLLNYPDSKITDLLQTDVFDNLQSDLYQNIKADMIESGKREIEKNIETYYSVLNRLKDRIGKDFEKLSDNTKFELKGSFNQIFESATPMLSISEFKTNAQKISKDDAVLEELIKFINNNTKNATPSLNLLLGIAKEEHIENNLKHNLPAYDKVVEMIEKYKDSGDSEIEQGIRNGIFKNINSKLMSNIKVDIDGNIPETESLSRNNITDVPEHAPMNKLLESLQDVVVFNPLGMMYEDKENNQKLAYINNQLFNMEVIGDKLNFVQNTNPINLPNSLVQFNTALHKLNYNPFENKLTPASPYWDFDVFISNDGLFVSPKDTNITQSIEPKDLFELFVETIEVLEGTELNFQEIEKLKDDANNFMVIANNRNRLVQFADLTQIQNTTDNNYVIVPSEVLNESEDVDKKIVSSNTSDKSESFPTYQELIWNINKRIGINTEESLNTLFKPQLATEANNKILVEQQIQELKSNQTELNKQINTKKELLKLAEAESPAAGKIQMELDRLNSELEKNINDLELLIQKRDGGKDSE